MHNRNRTIPRTKRYLKYILIHVSHKILCRIGTCTTETELYPEQTASIVQGYPKRLNFMRRLYGIYTGFFLIFMNAKSKPIEEFFFTAEDLI